MHIAIAGNIGAGKNNTHHHARKKIRMEGTFRARR